MSAASDTCCAIYRHEQSVTRAILHPDGDRCITVSWDRMRMFYLKTRATRDFGQFCHKFYDAVLLNEDTLVSVGVSNKVSVWSLSNGKLQCTLESKLLEYAKPPFRMFSVGNDCFMIAATEIDAFADQSRIVVLQLVPCRTTGRSVKPAHLSAVFVSQSPLGFFRHICVNREYRRIDGPAGNIEPGDRNIRFATAGPGYNVQVWEWNGDMFHIVHELRQEAEVLLVSLGNGYLCTADENGIVRLYDSQSFDCLCLDAGAHLPYIYRPSSSFPVRIIPVRNDKILFLSNEDEVILHDCQKKRKIWEKKFEQRVSDIALTPEGTIIVQMERGQVYKCLPRPSISSQLCEEGDGVSLPPLQDALISCLSGHSFPHDHCDSLITYEACKSSFAEWCSAHHLLVLAVRDGKIEPSTEHLGNPAHWHQNLYIAVIEIEFTSEEDFMVAKRYLREAVKLGLIEGLEGTLGAKNVSIAVNNQVKELRRAVDGMTKRVNNIESHLKHFIESYEQYRRTQFYSQCIGMALHFIPIVGGAAAGLLTAGADIVEGLSAKDVADYIFGLGSSLTEEKISSLGERVMEKAASALSPESISGMQNSGKRFLEEAVSRCDLNVEELRQFFIANSPSPDAIYIENVDFLDRAGAETVDMNAPEFQASNQSGHEMYRNPSELESFDLTSANISEIEELEIAEICAAFIVRHKDTRIEEFMSLRDRICRVMKDNGLDGGLLQSMPRKVFRDTIEHGLNNDGHGVLSLGVRTKLKEILKKLSKASDAHE